MKYLKTGITFIFILILPLLSCSQDLKDDGKIEVVFIQINDVYEIAALDNGTSGGMARVATLKSKLEKENPNTYSVMAGDFLFPSAIGTLKFEGESIKGRQMVECMNTAGIDLAAFGNHEFDLKENELLQRINESQFDWIGGNIFHNTTAGKIPFSKTENHSLNLIPATRILSFKDADGTILRAGIVSVTINSTVTPYVYYEDYTESMRKSVNAVKNHCDIIIGLTHLSIEDDKKMAAGFPEIKFIMGGHEHIASYDTVGKVIIAKADANARTAYVHRINFNNSSKEFKLNSELVKLDGTIAEDPKTLQVVNKWVNIANQNLRAQGFIPDEQLRKLDAPYDGRESEVRYRSTNLTRMIAKSFSAAVPGSDCSIFNSGSIRVDDELHTAITQYDIIRTLPYGGKLLLAEMKGSLLIKALDTASAHPGNGCFLQYDRIEKDRKNKKWTINGKVIDPEKIYKVAANDYLMSGMQEYLQFLNPGNPDIIKITAPAENETLKTDLRKAVINYLKKGGS